MKLSAFDSPVFRVMLDSNMKAPVLRAFPIVDPDRQPPYFFIPGDASQTIQSTSSPRACSCAVGLRGAHIASSSYAAARRYSTKEGITRLPIRDFQERTDVIPPLIESYNSAATIGLQRRERIQCSRRTRVHRGPFLVIERLKWPLLSPFR